MHPDIGIQKAEILQDKRKDIWMDKQTYNHPRPVGNCDGVTRNPITIVNTPKIPLLMQSALIISGAIWATNIDVASAHKKVRN